MNEITDAFSSVYFILHIHGLLLEYLAHYLISRVIQACLT